MYKHLDHTTTEEYRNREVPAIPYPRIYKRKVSLFSKREECQCACGIRFLSMDTYMHHYRTEQLIELNEQRRYEVERAATVPKLKALYWRRRCFVLEYGTPADIKEVKLIESPELKSGEDLAALVDRVTDIWGPLYKEYAAHNNVTVGQVLDETTIEDETPEEARRG